MRATTRRGLIVGAAALAAYSALPSKPAHSVWATPNDAVADLRDFMDQRYGVGGWSYRSGPHLGTDALPAMNAALSALRARYGYGVVRIVSNGAFKFSGGIDPNLLKGMIIEAPHPQVGHLCFDMDGGVAMHWSGAGGFTSGGTKRLRIWIEYDHPLSLAYCILLQGDATFQPDDMTFEDTYVYGFGSSRWYNGFMGYGNARSSPQGIRVVDIRNLQIFCCRNFAAYFSNAVQWNVTNLGSYVGSGTGNDVYIVGGTSGMTLSGAVVSGNLFINNCQRVRIEASAAVCYADPSADYVSGFIEGPVSGSWGIHSDVTHG